MTKTIALVQTGTDSPAARAAGLFAAAKSAAADQVALILTQMGDLTRLADEVAEGGDVYPPGVRDQMRRMAEHLQNNAVTIASIMERVR